MRSVVIGTVGFCMAMTAGTGFVQAQGEIAACVNIRNGQVRIVDAGAACRRNESKFFWNIQGPQGEPGPAGSGGVNVIAGDNAAIGPLVGLSSVVFQANGVSVSAPVGPLGFSQSSSQVLYLDSACTGPAYTTISPLTVFIYPLTVFGLVGYYLPADAVGFPAPGVLPPGPGVAQGYWFKFGAAGPCQVGTSYLGSATLYPLVTVNLAAFPAPFRLE